MSTDGIVVFNNVPDGKEVAFNKLLRKHYQGTLSPTGAEEIIDTIQRLGHENLTVRDVAQCLHEFQALGTDLRPLDRYQKCIDCGREDVTPNNAWACAHCGQIVCERCAYEIETRQGLIGRRCAACATKLFPKRKISRSVEIEVLLACGHLATTSEEALYQRATIPCEKCYYQLPADQNKGESK